MSHEIYAQSAESSAKAPPSNTTTAVQEQPVKKKNASALKKAIETALENEDFFEAEGLLKQVTESVLKEDPKFLFYQAVVAKGLYRLNDAESLLKQSLRKDKSDGDALFEMALLLMEKKKWKDAEVLLYLAGNERSLSQRRQVLLPYYLGVASFESGKIFSARNSFSRLNWANALDPALEQSASAFLGRIARVRPWSIIAPLTWQYESNMLGISEATPLPEGYSQRQGSKVTAGLFTQWNGLGGESSGEGPWGLALRLLSIRALPDEFKALNVLFIEPELNWSRFLGERWGMFKWAAVANRISVGGEATTASGLLRLTFLEAEASAGYEADLQKSSTSNRSVFLLRVSREWPVWARGSLSLGLPVELGARIPTDKQELGEQRLDAALAPALSWTPMRRVSVKLSEKLAYESVSTASNATVSFLRNTPGLTISYIAQPYLVLSSSVAYELEKKSSDADSLKKASASISILGLL
ncbi:MAG: tetratricopeptide repeat protein [Betaproteobacteria bacterium]|nr:tetratricopeptide repeat protein [Betaproteobacteria bacterium]